MWYGVEEATTFREPTIAIYTFTYLMKGECVIFVVKNEIGA